MQIVAYDEERLVKRHRGVMPVLLTAPHGGSAAPPGVEDERKDEETPPGCDFSKKRDNETALITEATAQRLLDLTGLSPYVVVAQFHRKFVDANRREECA